MNQRKKWRRKDKAIIRIYKVIIIKNKLKKSDKTLNNQQMKKKNINYLKKLNKLSNLKNR